MAQNPKPEDSEVEEAQHLEVEPYDDKDRVEAPEWYDDTINVGDKANAEAEPYNNGEDGNGYKHDPTQPQPDWSDNDNLGGDSK